MENNLQIPDALTRGGDCDLHFHSADRAPTHDTRDRLNQLMNQISVATNYAARYSDDLIMVTTGATVTLPLARNGKEFTVIQNDATPCTVALSSPNTIFGNTSVSLTTQGTSLTFKAITGGWVLI